MPMPAQELAVELQARIDDNINKRLQPISKLPVVPHYSLSKFCFRRRSA
jgi:hypothetical protein